MLWKWRSMNLAEWRGRMGYPTMGAGAKGEGKRVYFIHTNLSSDVDDEEETGEDSNNDDNGTSRVALTQGGRRGAI